jgi:hypothetical protein
MIQRGNQGEEMEWLQTLAGKGERRCSNSPLPHKVVTSLPKSYATAPLEIEFCNRFTEQFSKCSAEDSNHSAKPSTNNRSNEQQPLLQTTLS